jgi:hypothetical protein
MSFSFDLYGNFENYIFFVRSTKVFDTYRFNGPFLEPGHLGMICAFILYANRFDVRNNRYLWVILIVTLLTLSLAAYVLLFLGISFFYINKVSHIIRILFLLFLCHYIVTTVWNSGDNYINNLILARLKFDEVKGISGNNRISYSTDKYYKKFVLTHQVLTGVGQQKYASLSKNRIIAGAGYKIYILQNGIIGLLLVFLFYYKIVQLSPNRRYAYCFLLLLLFAFLQRAYPMWFSWLFLFICGTSRYKIAEEDKYENSIYT